MKGYVIDVNILFSGVLSQKEIYKKIFSDTTFYTPDFALIELKKYREIILKKAKVKASTLKEFTLFIFSKIIIVPDYIISNQSFQKAEELCRNIDPKDTVYVALTEELDIILLTRDKKLHDGLIKQGYTKVLLFDDFIEKIINSQKSN
jgi:predicted nucleic acid-binding protein